MRNDVKVIISVVLMFFAVMMLFVMHPDTDREDSYQKWKTVGYGLGLLGLVFLGAGLLGGQREIGEGKAGAKPVGKLVVNTVLLIAGLFIFIVCLAIFLVWGTQIHRPGESEPGFLSVFLFLFMSSLAVYLVVSSVRRIYRLTRKNTTGKRLPLMNGIVECRNCSQPNSADSIFCSKCGTKLRD